MKKIAAINKYGNLEYLDLTRAYRIDAYHTGKMEIYFIGEKEFHLVEDEFIFDAVIDLMKKDSEVMIIEEE